MPQKKRERIRRPLRETMKLIACAVLFLLVCVTVFSYLFQMGLLQRRTADATDYRSLFAATEDATEREPGILPDFIGLCSADGAKTGVTANRNAVLDLYREIMGDLAPALAGIAFSPLTDGDAAWMAAAAGECVYLRYSSSLPVSCIAAEVQKDVSRILAGTDCLAKEMLISLDTNGGARLLVRDDEGTVYAAAWMKTSLTVPALSLTAGNVGTCSFCFLYESRDAGEMTAFSPTQPLPAGTIRLPEITVAYPFADFEGETGQDWQTEILSLFSYNADKLNSYREGNVTVCVQPHGQLRLAPDGFTYTAFSDGGLDCVTDSEVPSENAQAEGYRAMLLLCDRVSGLARHYFGGDARLSVKTVEYRGDVLHVEWEYRYANLPVAEGQPAAEMELRDGKLISAAFRYRDITSDLLLCSTYPARWAVVSTYRQWLTAGGNAENYVSLDAVMSYRVSDADEKGQIRPGWHLRGYRMPG